MNTQNLEKRERCKSCGCFLGFDMGQEGDGDYCCNNPKCKANTNDWRLSYGEDVDLRERIIQALSNGYLTEKEKNGYRPTEYEVIQARRKDEALALLKELGVL